MEDSEDEPSIEVELDWVALLHRRVAGILLLIEQAESRYGRNGGAGRHV